ncbi:MAG: response regulator [Bacteroidales bacterium]|nr:response regulator [Bacteroidales bacterium]
MIGEIITDARILIVDDQRANIEVLEGFLEMEGYENIKATTDPRDVMGLLDSFKPDLILLDLAMPYLNGFEVLEQINSTIKKSVLLPVLVLTADVTKETKLKALASGANDFVTKPFDLIEVGLRIKNLLFVRYLQQQLRQQNVILEEKVKERTLDLIQQNEELVKAKEKAEASDRLKTAFINNISHEIRTPLNGILGFSEFLIDKNLPENERVDYLSIIETSSERLIRTVTSFMDIALLTSGNVKVIKKSFVFCDLMDEIVSNYKTRFERKGIMMHRILLKKSIHIFTDRGMLYKILDHLFDNALKFTPSGHIEFGCELKREDWIDFYIEDTGVGIADDVQKNILKSFMQEDDSDTRLYEGSGLGLSIVTGYVDLLGGKLEFKSKKGEGSRFILHIPIGEEGKVYDDSESESDKVESKESVILVVDDDDFNYSYLEILLTTDSVNVIRANNGLEALSICKDTPDIDIILMDLKMPVMDGFQAAKLIKEIKNDIPIIAVTAYSNSEESEEAREAGCDDFISKPLKRDLLIDKLKKYGISIDK